MWSPVVTWLSPRENDTFGSWDTLTVKWSSREVLDSPAFRLCIPPDDSLRTPFLPSQNQMEEAYMENNCGSKISPTVEESDGSFLTSFTVPDITDDAFFLLQMNDASGTVLSSPIFKLSPHPIHVEVRTRLPQLNFALDTEPQGPPAASTIRQPLPAARFAIPLVFICMLLTALILLLLYCHRKRVKLCLRGLGVSPTPTPALLQKINPGDGTSVPIPVFMPARSQVPSQSLRPLHLPSSLGRASGVTHSGNARSFRLPNHYSGRSTYPSLPPIPTSSNTFINEGDTWTTDLAANTIHISRRPLLPPGLVNTPLRVHLRPSE